MCQLIINITLSTAATAAAVTAATTVFCFVLNYLVLLRSFLSGHALPAECMDIF